MSPEPARYTAHELAYEFARQPGSGRRVRGLSDELVPGLVGFADVLAVVVSGVVCFGAYLGWSYSGLAGYVSATALMAALTVFLFRGCRCYDFEVIASWPARASQMLIRLAFVALLLTGLAFAFKVSDQFSRIWLLSTVLVSGLSILTLRGIAATAIRRAAHAGVLSRTVAIVGAGDQAARFIDRLQAIGAPWTRIVGVFDDRRTRITDVVGGIPLRGSLDDLIAAIRRREVDEVVIALPWNAEERLVSLITRLRDLPVHICLGDDLIRYRLAVPHRAFAGGVSVLEVARTPLSGWQGVAKAVEDKVLAAVALFLFGPLMALVALAIRLDSPGPILFRQKRYGFNNELIEVFKFRSMHHHMRDINAETQTQKNDPRITRVGQFLRRTSLDELPQLFNVWNGTMSMVGPRPHATRTKAGERLLQEVVLEYAARHKVKPGITGWAQVNGWRGAIDSEEKIKRRVEHDLFYIENWSLWFDIKICVMTLWSGFQGENAY